jgi:hypothetical protein
MMAMSNVEGQPGRFIMAASWACSALFAAATAIASLDPSSLQVVALTVDLLLFAIGLAVFALALVAGAQRSRTHELGIGGWFFLMGSAPRPVQRHLLGSLAAQLVVGLAGAARDINSALIFGTLVPVLGLGWCGLWAARHGTFGQRAPAGRVPGPAMPSNNRATTNDRPRSSPRAVPVGQNERHG